jgi:hypothetical protein
MQFHYTRRISLAIRAQWQLIAKIMKAGSRITKAKFQEGLKFPEYQYSGVYNQMVLNKNW